MTDKTIDVEDDFYLSIDGFAGPHLILIKEINSCFKAQRYTSVTLHIRSLLEALLTDILLKNPGPSAVFENREKAYRHGLHRLLETFWSLVFDDFKAFFVGYSHETQKELERTSWSIKKQGDKTAHEMVVQVTEKSLLKQRESVQILFAFLWHAPRRLPESIQLSEVKKEREERDKIVWIPSYPTPFPSTLQALHKRIEIYHFKFVIEIKPMSQPATCTVNISSNSNAIVFIRDKPYRKFNWKRLRYETSEISLYDNITNRIGMTKPTLFEFNGVYRPKFVDLLSKRLVIRYHITGKTHDETKTFDTRTIRVDIPLEDDAS